MISARQEQRIVSFQFLGQHLLLSLKFQTGLAEGQQNTELHFSPVHIFVLGSKQNHFDSLCLGCMAIILSFSAAVFDAENKTRSQVLLYSIYTDLHLYFLRNSLLG